MPRACWLCRQVRGGAPAGAAALPAGLQSAARTHAALAWQQAGGC